MSEISCPSPCVGQCCLNDEDICIGCGRLLEEIVNWSGRSDEEKVTIVRNAAQRVQNFPRFS